MTKAIPNNLASVPGSVKKEAAMVQTEADLAKVSPAARAFLMTPVQEVDTTTRTYVSAPPDGALVAAGAKGPAIAGHPDAFNGWWPPGCWQVWSRHDQKSWAGWTLVTAITQINNWCPDGFGTVNPPSWGVGDPWAQFIGIAHWEYRFCGLDNQFSGYYSGRWYYGAGASFKFNVVSCAPWVDLYTSPQVFGYGDGRLYTY